MKEILIQYKDKFDKFIAICEEDLIAISTSKPREKDNSGKEENSYKLIVEKFGNSLINTIKSSLIAFSDTRSITKVEEEHENYDSIEINYEMINAFFHRFLIFYFEKYQDYIKIFSYLNFDFIYDKFKVNNINSNDFTIKQDTINLMKNALSSNIVDFNWFEGTKLKENYQILKNENLRSLVLLVNYLKNRKVKKVKI